MLIHKTPADCKPSLWKTWIKRLTLWLYERHFLSVAITQYIIDRFKLQEA